MITCVPGIVVDNDRAAAGPYSVYEKKASFP